MKRRMPKRLWVWFIGFVVYLSVHWMGGKLLGGTLHDPFHSLPALALGAFAYGGVLSWLQTVGGRPKPPPG